MDVQDTAYETKTDGRTPGSQSLPIVAIAGTRGKSTVSWLITEMLRQSGHSTGIWASTGVFMNGEHLVGELGPWARVMQHLANGELDAAVQELENSVINGVGLPENIYPIAAVTTLCGNNDKCLISDEFREGSIAIDSVARAVRADGHLVLNADDQAVLAAADSTNAAVTLFALHPENPSLRHHREQEGRAVWLSGTEILASDGQYTETIADVERAHFTLDGSLTFQVQNLLCSVAVARDMGIPATAIRAAIEVFEPDPELMPGSCNILRHHGATILLDSARQVWTVRSLVRGIRDSAFYRTVVVTDCFCHLDADQTMEAGRLLGRVADVVVTHRNDAQSAGYEAFKDGLARNDVPPLIFAMPTESDAIEHALRMLDPSDLCLCLTGNIQDAISIIRRTVPATSETL